MDTGNLKIGSCEEFNGKEWERGERDCSVGQSHSFPWQVREERWIRKKSWGGKL